MGNDDGIWITSTHIHFAVYLPVFGILHLSTQRRPVVLECTWPTSFWLGIFREINRPNNFSWNSIAPVIHDAMDPRPLEVSRLPSSILNKNVSAGLQMLVSTLHIAFFILYMWGELLARFMMRSKDIKILKELTMLLKASSMSKKNIIVSAYGSFYTPHNLM